MSCNPRALARDLAELVGRGLEIRWMRAYDMFPHTPHVEVVAMLAARQEAKPAGRAPRRRRIRG